MFKLGARLGGKEFMRPFCLAEKNSYASHLYFSSQLRKREVEFQKNRKTKKEKEK